MSALSTLGGALLVEAGALVLNCCCLALDIVCDKTPCLRDWDCKFYPNCICIDGTCDGAIQEECPPGYTEVPLDDGSGLVECIPNCDGQPCATDEDCDPVNNPGCICVDGRCIPSSDAFFCIDGECQRGGDLEYDPTDPDKPKGPYATYQACCMSVDEDGNMCGCGFACTDSCQCIPSELQQDYESYQECRAECCDPTDGGRCCYNEVIKDDQGNLISVEWYDCVNSLNEDCKDGPIEPYNGGTRQITSSFTKGVDCDEGGPPDPNLPWGEGCPIPEYGACCILDVNGNTIDCIEETKAVCEDMPNRPGDFPQYPPGFDTDSKSAAWLDCFTRRNPSLREDFACSDCNGEKDCACQNTERCTGQECSLCYDNDPTKRGAMVRAQFGVDRQIGDVSKGETVSFYIRDCSTDAAGNPVPNVDRRAKIFISGSCGDSAEVEISDEGALTVEVSGTLYVTGIDGIPEVQVCITLERDVPIKDGCADCYPYDVDSSDDIDGAVRWDSSVGPYQYFADEWTWEDGYPQCFTGGLQLIRFERRWSDGLTGEVTRQWDTKFFTCDNGSMTEVTQFVKFGAPMGFTVNCDNGADQLAVAAGLDNLKGEYTYDAQLCKTENTWNAYGLRPGLQGEPPKYNMCGRFQCPETCAESQRYNPLP